jgi:hypothetical protein
VLDVKRCPTCGREITGSASVCDACEAWAAAVVESRPADEAVPSSTATPVDDAPVAAATATVPASGVAVSRRQLTLIAAAVGAIALTGFAISARGGSPSASTGTTAVPVAPVTPAPTTTPATTVAAAVQTWSADNHGGWLDNPRQGAAFELPSENVVKTAFGAVHPSLVVRCMSKSIEAFVVTGSPMKIDPRVDGKTVTISMDGEPSRTEHWIDSDRHTAVFAPDPAAFAQRLRTARALQFGFSPHNSSDVVAEFHVDGIDALMAAASKHCGATK